MNKSSKVLLMTIGGALVAIGIIMAAYRYVTADSIDYADAKKLAEWETMVVGNNLYAKTMSLPTFSSLSANGNFDVAIKQGNESKISIATDKQVFPNIHVTLKNNDLALSQHENIAMPTVKAAVTTKNIKNINLDGQTMIHANNIQGQDLTINMDGNSVGYVQGDIKAIKINLNGDAELHFDAANEDTIYVQINGNGKLFLSGTAKELSILSAGNADVNAAQLTVNDVNINAAGASTVMVNVTNQLTINAVGSCAVKYSGNPVVKKNVIGESTVEQVNMDYSSAN
jgi:hypothetical protein